MHMKERFAEWHPRLRIDLNRQNGQEWVWLRNEIQPPSDLSPMAFLHGQEKQELLITVDSGSSPRLLDGRLVLNAIGDAK